MKHLAGESFTLFTQEVGRFGFDIQVSHPDLLGHDGLVWERADHLKIVFFKVCDGISQVHKAAAFRVDWKPFTDRFQDFLPYMGVFLKFPGIDFWEPSSD